MAGTHFIEEKMVDISPSCKMSHVYPSVGLLMQNMYYYS